MNKGIIKYFIGVVIGILVGFWLHVNVSQKEDSVEKYIYKGNVYKKNDLSFERDIIYADHVDPYGVYDKKDGVVPNPQIAADLAEIILFPIYGKREIVKQRPYCVELLNNRIWVISGSLSPKSEGGCFTIFVEKQNGKILLISHGK
jgi:hypothetical protein